MTRDRARELLPIIQAYAAGKEIQFKCANDVAWDDITLPGGIATFADGIQYRIKPREFWLSEYYNGVPFMAYSESEIEQARNVNPGKRFIHVREVL